MAEAEIEIRRLQPGDGERLRDIYNHYIEHTPITFDIEPRSPAQWSEWMDRFSPRGRYQCFVAVASSGPVGWAASSQYKPRQAYDPSVETSVYLAPGHERAGIGRRLYARLFEALAGEPVHRAFAAITAPNPASVGLHQSFGFRLIGTFGEVGYKFGAYHDVEWYWRPVPLDPS